MSVESHDEVIEAPTIFPVVDSEEPEERKGYAQLEEGTVEHYFVKNRMSEGETEYFMLPAEIDALSYVFELHSVYGMHELSFMTEEYGYASTNLSEEGSEKLAETLAAFVNSVVEKYPLSQLYVKPAPESAAVRDIEDCIEEILLVRSYTTREELLREYKKKGWQELFALYHVLYGKKFERSSDSIDRTEARGRLFRQMLKRVLPDWEIEVITEQKWILRKKDNTLSSDARS